MPCFYIFFYMADFSENRFIDVKTKKNFSRTILPSRDHLLTLNFTSRFRLHVAYDSSVIRSPETHPSNRTPVTSEPTHSGAKEVSVDTLIYMTQF